MQKVNLSEREKAILKALIEGLELCETPFAQISERLGLSEEEVIETIKNLKEKGVIVRLGITLRHNLAGIEGNAMVAWKVDEEKEDYIGKELSQLSYVSHCYVRKTYEDWPYNLYTMIHGKTREEVLERIKEISERFGLREYQVLFTVKEIVRKHANYKL